MWIAPLSHSLSSATRAVPLARVLRVLRQVRVEKVGLSEDQLHAVISRDLKLANIEHQREERFAKGCRADFWIAKGIVIEVKKRRPVRAQLLAQLTRYAACPQVRYLVVMLERSIVVPEHINGVPVHMVSMNAAWGISV